MLYKFLVSNGNGAASRGTDVDNYYECSCEANDIKDAYRKLVFHLYAEDEGFDSLQDWFLDYFGYNTPQEAKDDGYDFDTFDFEEWFEQRDISGGEQFVVGIKEDDQFIMQPDMQNIMEYGCDLDSINLQDWFSEGEIEYYYNEIGEDYESELVIDAKDHFQELEKQLINNGLNYKLVDGDVEHDYDEPYVVGKFKFEGRPEFDLYCNYNGETVNEFTMGRENDWFEFNIQDIKNVIEENK